LCLLAALLPVSVCTSTAQAADIVIISQTDTPMAQLKQADLINIFRRKQRVSEWGQVLVPVNLPAMHPLRQAFTRIVLGRNPESMQDYWNQQYFHGISPPYVLASQEAVIRFVSKTPGAIAYVLECRVDSRTRVLLRLQVPADMQASFAKLCP